VQPASANTDSAANAANEKGAGRKARIRALLLLPPSGSERVR
jgi:hypothetical protein